MITYKNGQWGELYIEVVEEEEDNRIIHPEVFVPFTNTKEKLMAARRVNSLTALCILTDTPPCGYKNELKME